MLSLVGVISLPLFNAHSYVFGHDVEFHFARIEGMAIGLADGQFPVRINGFPFNGYGEMSPIFYPNLFLYIPALLRLSGCSFVVAYNIFFILINLSTALLTYRAFNLLLNDVRKAATIAMLYTGFFYRLVDIYSRAAIGEALAMAFMPLALISMWLLLNRSTKMWSDVVIGFTGVLQSHLLSTVFLIVAVLSFVLISWRRLRERKIQTALGKTIFLVALINLWFYFPFISMYHQIRFTMQDAASMYFNMPSYNSFPLISMAAFQCLCGWSIVLILVEYIYKSCRMNALERQKFFSSDWFSMLIVGVMFTIAATTLFPWSALESVPYIGARLAFIQFPFRFMMFASIALSCCAGLALTESIEEKYSDFIVAGLCILIAQVNLSYLTSTIEANKFFRIEYRQEMSDETVRLLRKSGFFDYLPAGIGRHDIFRGYRDGDKVDLRLETNIPFDEVIPADIVSDFRKFGTTIEFTAHTSAPTSIRLPLFYYPGYEAVTSMGERPAIHRGESNRLTVDVPSGETHVKVRYVGQRSWRIAELISIAGVIAFAICLRRNEFSS